MSDLVVRPVRFTENVDGMRAFLTTLGLRPRVESVEGGWVDMLAGGGSSGGGGMVALHSAKDSASGAPSGFTALSFEADDVDVVGQRLEAAGVPDVAVYDEAYGRVLSCRDPLGEEIVIDERSTDLYGYRLNEPGDVVPGWQVMAVRFADPQGQYGSFLEVLGLERRGEASEHFTAYAIAGGAHGVVGLHPPTPKAVPHMAEAGAVSLSFETTEPLDSVVTRLTDHGFAPSLRQEAFGAVLAVVDADGISVEVLEAPASPA